MPEFDPSTAARDAGDPSDGGGAHGGRLMAAALKASGVDTIFALCGGHVLGVLDGCLDEGIRVVDCRHEGAASLAAEGWALATGRTGVALVTAGPGFANALTGFLDAAVWTAPLLLLAGRTGTHQAGRGAVMDIDQRAIVAPVAKWAATCYDTARIPWYVETALHRARSGKPGAVYLEAPQDVLMATAPNGPGPGGAGPGGAGTFGASAAAGYPAGIVRSAGDPADVERALEALRRAERPLLVAGGGAFWSGAGEALARFAETCSVPVTTTSAARGVLPDSHPWCLGSLIHAGVAALAADVVVVAGSRFDANLAFGQPPLFSATQTVVQIDAAPESLGGNRRPDVAIAGDVARVLGDLADGWATNPAELVAAREAWLEQARELRGHGLAAWDAQVDGWSGSRGVHAGALARMVARVARKELGERVTFVADGGDMLTWGLAYAYAEGPGRLLSTTTALGTLGVGMPFANAAAAARPDEPAILLTGDGAFGLSAMEVDTAARHGLNVVAIVSNNRGWGDVAHEQRAWFGRETASALAPTRYDRLGESLGAAGFHAETLEEVEPVLRAALREGGPAVIDVATDPDVLSDLLRNLASMNLM